MSERRAAALIAVLCAVCVASLALPWFRAGLVDRAVTFSGPQIAPAMWGIAPAAILIAALVVRATRAGVGGERHAWRALMVALAVAIIAGSATLACVIAPGAEARADGVAAPPPVPLDRLPAGLVAAGAFAGIAAMLCAWLGELFDYQR